MATGGSTKQKRPTAAAAKRRATTGAAPRTAAGASGAAAAPSAARRPQQERGQRRVEAILDAAAEIAAEEGVPAVTMHAIARRSGTTVGSLYHFFPDRETVFIALLERHGQAFGALVTGLGTVDWSRLSPADAIDRFVDSCVGYVRAHPELLPIAHTMHALRPDRPRDERPEQLLMVVAESIVAARSPRSSAAARSTRAAMMLAAVEGAVERWHRVPVPSVTALQRELKRMLVAYLESFE